MPVATSINARIEAAVKSLFPSTTIGGAAISMHVIDNNTVKKADVYAVVECKELTRLHPTLLDYSAIIELAAISQIVEDKSAAKCDELYEVLTNMFGGAVTKSTLSTASSLTVDAVLPDTSASAGDETFNVRTVSAKIYIQNAT
jgi:hypothetical protein